MLHILIENPLLLLFPVAAVGYPLGRIGIRGSRLGVASVLFTGLAISLMQKVWKIDYAAEAQQLRGYGILPHGDTVLELGDRVRVISDRERMDEVSAFFGDSYRAVSEVDILTFSLGLAFGLFVGTVPIPLPGEAELRLGFAGGPLLTALVLGILGRTGPMVWSLPYGANRTLRQIGLILFLAGIGTRAGYGFVTTFAGEGGMLLFAAGAFITCTTALAMLWIGYRILKIPMSLLIGMLAGLQTQSAVLGFAMEQTRNDLPTVGYASVYPVATIAKIILAQLLLMLLTQH